MDFKRETQKYLAFLGEGIEMLGKDISTKREVPLSLEKALCGLKAMAIVNGEYFPTNLNDIYELISKPISEWNLDFITEAIKGFNISDLVIYQDFIEDDDDDVLLGAKKLKNTLSESNIDEYFSLSQQFYEMRNELNEEEYVIFRQGLQNSIVKNLEFNKIFAGLDKKFIEQIKKLFYTDLNPITQVSDGKIHICPTCGYPMEAEGHLFYCPMNKCKQRRDKEKKSYILGNSIELKGNYKVLTYEAQAFIKIPGMAEDALMEKLALLNKKYKCIKEMKKYPVKDLADLLVEFEDGSIDIIDVKDYRESMNLVKYLNSNGDITVKKGVPKFNEAYIIIPDYLEDKYYINNFENNIGNKNLKISSISNYIKMLEEKYKI